MAADPNNIPIATIPKNAKEEVRVAISHFRGHDFIDVRVYTSGTGQERVPTPRGVALRPDAVPQLVAALQKAADLYQREVAQ